MELAQKNKNRLIHRIHISEDLLQAIITTEELISIDDIPIYWKSYNAVSTIIMTQAMYK